MVGDLRRVEHALRLLQRLAANGLDELRIDRLAEELRLVETVHGLRTLRVDVVREVLRVDTRIGGEFLLVECLDEVQRRLGRESELAVAVDLQRGEVVELGRLFLTLFLLDLRDGERLALDGLKGLLALFLRREFAFCSCKRRVAVDGSQHPVGLGLEVVDLLLAVDDEGEGRGLHTSDGEYLTILPVFQRVEPGGIHAQEPVANGSRETCQIEWLVVGLVLEISKAFADGLVGHRRYPQTADGTLRARLLHDPALDEFTLLSGVAAVDDAVGFLHEVLNDGELFLDALVVDELDAKALRYHGQRRQTPRTPHGGVVVGFFQRTQVTKGPSDLKTVAFHISVVARRRPDNSGNVARYTGFLCNTNYHTRCKGTKNIEH